MPPDQNETATSPRGANQEAARVAGRSSLGQHRFWTVTAAVLVSVATLVGTGGSASAVVVDPRSTGITLDTNISLANDTLTIDATGTFTTSFIENTTVTLQVAGQETWTDATGRHTRALTALPTSVVFGSTNKVTANFSLHPNSLVEVAYTAIDVGLTPSPFTGSCYGAGLRLSSSGSPLTTKDC